MMHKEGYFGLKRGVIYFCSADSVPNKFEYKLHKHYLVYRKIGRDDAGRKTTWRGVWNSKFYDDSKVWYWPAPIVVDSFLTKKKRKKK